MEKVGDFDNNAVNAPLPTDIGREFVRQYYKKWSMNPNEVYQFYGNESFFSHDEIEAVGQEDIQDAIEKLGYEDCKARIHLLTGMSGINESLLLQVCGELSVKGEPARRFLQSFVLCKQTAKKFFVQNDIFCWLDKAFNDFSSDVRSAAAAGTRPDYGIRSKAVEKKETRNADEVEKTTATLHQNGHSIVQPQSLVELSTLASHSVREQEQNVVEKSIKPALIVKTVAESIPEPVIAPTNNGSPPKHVNQKFNHNQNNKNRVREESNRVIGEQQHQQQQPDQPQEVHPKSWARAVSNSTSNNAVQNAVNVQSQVTQQPISTEPEEKLKDSDAPLNEDSAKSQQQPYREKRGNTGGPFNGGNGFRGGSRGGFATRGGGRPNYGFRNNNNNNFHRGSSGGGSPTTGGPPQSNRDGGPQGNEGGPRFNGQQDRRGTNNNNNDNRATTNTSSTEFRQSRNSASKN